MNFIVSLLVLIITFIVHSVLAWQMQIYSIRPDILFVVVLCYAMLEGKEKGAVFGFFAGMMMDFYWGKSFGVNTLLYTYSAYIGGTIAVSVFQVSLGLALILTVVLSFAKDIIYTIFTYLFTGDLRFWFMLLHVSLPAALYNTLVCIPLFLMLNKLRNRMV